MIGGIRVHLVQLLLCMAVHLKTPFCLIDSVQPAAYVV
jgi:hypothetical protein